MTFVLSSSTTRKGRHLQFERAAGNCSARFPCDDRRDARANRHVAHVKVAPYAALCGRWLRFFLARRVAMTPHASLERHSPPERDSHRWKNDGLSPYLMDSEVGSSG